MESAAKDGSVSPEVLFDVAKRWFELYEESRQNQIEHEPQSQHNDMQLQSNGQQQQQPSSIPRNNSNPHMMMAATTTMEVRFYYVLSVLDDLKLVLGSYYFAVVT